MTVSELSTKMSLTEFRQWQMYFAYKAERARSSDDSGKPNLLEGDAEGILKGFGV